MKLIYDFQVYSTSLKFIKLNILISQQKYKEIDWIYSWDTSEIPCIDGWNLKSISEFMTYSFNFKFIKLNSKMSPKTYKVIDWTYN